MAAPPAVVDILEDSPMVSRASAPSSEDLKQAMVAHLAGRELASVSLKVLRKELEERLGLPAGGLDARREELKQLAQAYAQASAAAAPPSTTESVSPAVPTAPTADHETQPAKKRKTLLVGGGGGGGTANAAGPAGAVQPGGAASAAPAKRKAAPSAFILWCSDNRSRIVQDLEARTGTKASLGELAKAMGEAWKQVSQADRAPYEQRAAAAKLEACAAGPAPAEGRVLPKEPRQSKGRGKGAGAAPRAAQGDGGTDAFTRVAFLSANQGLQCTVALPDGTPLQSFALRPRLFKSGAAGWFQMADVQLDLGGRGLSTKAQLNVIVGGSKYWSDGEGLAELIAQRTEPTEEGAADLGDGPTSAAVEANGVQDGSTEGTTMGTKHMAVEAQDGACTENGGACGGA